MTLYREIAHKINQRIQQGLYREGERLPGVRKLSEQFGVSISTVVQAQRQLESQGAIEARARSGYYISHNAWSKPELPQISRPPQKPMPVTGQELVLQLALNANQDDFIRLGAAVPHENFLPMRHLQRALNQAARQYERRGAQYFFPPGLPPLCEDIARRVQMAGIHTSPDQVVIADGCQEAIALALRTVAKAGDIIAIESPIFYGLLQVIESLGMKALEIPTDPREGIGLSALQMALEQWPVKAVVVIPNFSNPMGSLMPDSHKQALVELTRKHQVSLIEDDIYGDLSFTGDRPRALKSFPGSEHVFYCSSFSKTVAPGLRLGWVCPPDEHVERVMYLKHVTNLAAGSHAQLTMLAYLQQGNHERYLRQVQASYRQQVDIFSHAISKYFPAGTRVTQPQGGFVLWIELDPAINTLELAHRAQEKRISLVPGQLFSATQKYQNCIRLNCAQPWTPRLEAALIELGKDVQQLFLERSAPSRTPQ